MTLYFAVDGVAEGAREVDPKKDLLAETKRHFPKARGVISRKEPEQGDVIVVTTNDDSK